VPQPEQLTRRSFLRVTFTATGALVVGSYVTGCTTHAEKRRASARPTVTPSAVASQAFEPNLFVRIDPDGTVTLTVHRCEMGQGVRTSLAMLLAEELDVDLADVHIEQSPANPAIGRQLTSGSGSIADNYTSLREAGAHARQVLVAAAAEDWRVPASDLRTDRGEVVQVSTGKRRPYGELVALAKRTKVSGSPILKDPKDFRLVGTSVPRVDGPAIVTGALVYGLDVRVPDMRFAVVARCPVSGGTLVRFDPAAAKAVPGVTDVVAISNGVAVVADNSWAAMQGRDALKVTWSEGERAGLSSAGITAQMRGRLLKAIAGERPKPTGALEAFYETAYLAHAPMEPLSCVADVRADRCEVWAPTQNPQDVQSYVRDAVGVPTTVNVTSIGGGFGRRLEVDFAVEAAETSKAVGRPVQVMWTREDDIRHDYYRQATMHWLRGAWDASGTPSLWRHLIAGPGLNGVIYQVGEEVLTEGLETSYNISDSRSQALLVDIPLPTGPWRAVMDGTNAFANECFMDELATAAHRDPVAMRMKLLEQSDPMRAVLALAAARGGWGHPAPPGRARGIACHTRHETAVAMVAEVSQAVGRPRVHRVVCAIDCGTVVNPDMVVQQVEGGVVFALTAMLYGAITFAHGRVQQGNFHDYPLLQMAEMPVVEVHIVPSTRPPSGVGEMAVPPLAPAVANALFVLTGKRVRSLPIAAES
jgi:CO/xanthine dehydrogenase Mo-binding subunit